MVKTQSDFFLACLDLEVGADKLSRNVGTEILLYGA